jgi:hypothetical protein
MAEDEIRLPRFEDWRSGFGGSVGLWDYASREGSLTLAFAFVSLLWPRLIEVDGCVLLEAQFDPTAFEQWRARLGDDRERIERTMNHMHLWDLFDPASEGVSESGLESLAAVIAQTWQAAFRQQFPERLGKAVVLSGDEEYGPTITMFTATHD